MESQPQNPEFRNNPVNFHPRNETYKAACLEPDGRIHLYLKG